MALFLYFYLLMYKISSFLTTFAIYTIRNRIGKVTFEITSKEYYSAKVLHYNTL